jgi:hypothetical protein
MRKLAILAFDDFIMNSTMVYTPQSLNDVLGLYDRLTVQAVADSIVGTATLTVTLEHSVDQRNWATKTTLISAAGIAVATPNIVGADTTTTGSLGYVRLGIQLPSAGTSAHIKLWVTGRDTVA